MLSTVTHFRVFALQLMATVCLGLVSLSVAAHPGHGKSFGTAEEPTTLLWVWLTLIGVCALVGMWRLYAALFGKKKAKTES